MARTISEEDFINGLEQILKDHSRLDLIGMIFSWAYDEASKAFNNNILEDWENEMIEDTEAYEDLVADFKENIEPSVITQYGTDDIIALSEAWNNWTDALCKEGRLTESQYDNWDNPY